MSKQPWFKFFPADWRGDAGLRMCSRAARGTWIDMLTIMHQAEPYGELRVNGKAVDMHELALVINCKVEDVAADIAELELYGVFSRRKNGVIYSRKMERDENRRRKMIENGKMGGNPKLCNNTTISQLVNQEDKPIEARGYIPEPYKKDTEPNGSVVETDVSPGDDEDEISIAFENWNITAETLGLPQAMKLTKRRRSQLRQRLKENGGLDGWNEALVAIQSSPFLLGQSASGWRADLDFLLQPSSFLKVIEGAYRLEKANGIR